MNKNQKEILLSLSNKSINSQREISKTLNISLGLVNNEINDMIENNYINRDYSLTNKSKELLVKCRPKRAIILAAGFGTRMVPINLNTPKALLEIKGEILIERIINQLNQVNIEEVYLVVGFMKEKFEYLIDKYNVKLIVNEHYIERNNLYSLFLAREHLENCYIIPSDIWCEENPFRKHELYSWYMLTDEIKSNTGFTYLKNGDIVVQNANEQNGVIGISYIKSEDSKYLIEKLEEYEKQPLHSNDFWETSLYNKNKMSIKGRVVDNNKYHEINTYEQLRELDSNSNQLKSDAIDIIKKIFNTSEAEIKSITSLKKGMTNRSFLFEIHNKKYIMRIPGEGTEKLINRKEEAEVYETIKGKNICDNIIYINPKNGYKITEYIENSRCCDAFNEEDLVKSMDFLKKFHDLDLKVKHSFNIW